MKKCLCLIIIMLMCLMTTSCSNNESDLSEKTNSSQVTLDEKQINEIINSIEFEYGIMSFVYYPYHQNELDELFRIGIDGVPILINKLENNKESYYDNFWLQGIYSILRIDRDFVVGEYSSAMPLNSFKKFLLDSRTKIPEIINSNETIDQKIDKLRKYGLLSIPYIKSMVRNHEMIYIPLFYLIGMHLQTSEWTGFYSYRTEKFWYKSDDYLKNAKTFDYHEWLNNNWDSLLKVHNFINDYVQ